MALSSKLAHFLQPVTVPKHVSAQPVIQYSGAKNGFTTLRPAFSVHHACDGPKCWKEQWSDGYLSISARAC
jgi:hypothetical protein